MADDLDKKLKQIADMFGVSDTESLKNIVDNIMPAESGTSKQENLRASSDSVNVSSSPAPSSSGRNLSPNIDLISKAGEMMSMFNNVRDSRIILLNSVQPFLGPQRQQRLGGAIQLLKVISILNTISPTINNTTKG